MDLFSDLPEPEGDEKKQPDESNEATLQTSHNDVPTSPRLSEKTVERKTEDTQSPSAEVVSEKSDENAVSKRQFRDDDEDRPSVKRLAMGIYRLQGFSAERQGERDSMQDAHVILDDFTSHLTNVPSTISRMAYYAVFDGHSGDRASKHAARTLHTHLAIKFPQGEATNRDKEIKKCMIDTFKVTDEAFLKQASASKPVWKDGSTAVCVLVVDNTLYIANLGDSKAILCRFNPETGRHQPLPLTKDHSPTQYEERIRIQKAGGYVRDGRVMGIVEVSRSLGDGRFKHCGVSCVPDIKKCQLGASDRFLLMACDGLWKGFTEDSAIQFINEILDEEDIKQVEGRSQDEVRFETACNRLASEAIRRGSSDNITVVLVNIQNK
ncbi:integrin-linked kinase-associated serine/threonine phosphatase 2C-like [Diadema antillarum]|uniref:integrin-linked kinase-associated serine/threonine phosphatase 2C-like n=1 Tax=Diadema antillarum TaxID=105358 RepID=UPI003A8902D2